MLRELFPRAHGRFSSLPVLGSTLEGFVEFLIDAGYPREPVVRHVRTSRRVETLLQARGCRTLADLSREKLRACGPGAGRSQEDINLACAVRLLERHLDEQGRLSPVAAACAWQPQLDQYADFLRRGRGFARSTVDSHLATASQLMAHCATRSLSVQTLTPSDLEDFMIGAARRLSRASMQHEVAHLRAFLRFLAARGEAPSGLYTQIDTPRVYRGEKLPRSLPWGTVQAFLQAIDRSTPLGKRDYAMFLLITTYGLRACDVVGLRLEDVEWRAGRLRVAQRKTADLLWLPLTDIVADGLATYLRAGRPPVRHREIFVRHRAPAGLLKPTAVTEAFQCWSRRSALAIPFQGSHCLRHSYAVYLLRQGVSLKTIGDMLGHRNAESTCVYLRLAVDDLREVALDLPSAAPEEALP